MRLSADLHPVAKSRPLYRPLVDSGGLCHLIVSEASVGLPPELVGSAVAFCAGSDLAARLSGARIGLRLHVFGREAFVWDMFRVAQDAGLGEDEVSLHPVGPGRRVQCIHCKTVAEDVVEPAIDCAGCGLRLLVRDHFSRRLAAFQGVATHGATRGEPER